MTPMEFEKENKPELGQGLSKNIPPATLSLVETPGNTGATSIEGFKVELLQEYYEEKAIRKKGVKLRVGIGAGVIVLFPTLAFLLHAPFLVNFVGISTSALLVGAFIISERQKQVMMSLSCIEDPSLAGVLCEMLSVKDLKILSAARSSLSKILPKLNSSDFELLNRDQRLSLRNHLSLKRFANNSAYIEFQLAVLKSYEQIGGAEERAVVHELANNQTFAPSLREAANSCLPYLDIRIAEERERDQLLRASSFTTLGNDELLRPAEGSADSDPETLLRPVEEEDGHVIQSV